MKIYQKLEGESQKEWQAFQDFQQLGKGRTIKALHRQYQEEVAHGLTPPTKSYGTLRIWSGKNNWYERAYKWDDDQSEKQLAIIEKKYHEQYISRVEDFRSQSEQLGRQMLQSAIHGMMIVNQTFAKVSKDASEGKPVSMDRAIRLASVLSRMTESAQSMLGTSLGIVQLLEQMKAENEEK